MDLIGSAPGRLSAGAHRGSAVLPVNNAAEGLADLPRGAGVMAELDPWRSASARRWPAVPTFAAAWSTKWSTSWRKGATHGLATPISDVQVPLLAAASDGTG